MDYSEKQKLSDYFDSIDIKEHSPKYETTFNYRITFINFMVNLKVHNETLAIYDVSDNIKVKSLLSCRGSQCSHGGYDNCFRNHHLQVNIFEYLGSEYLEAKMYCVECSILITISSC